MLTRNIQRRFWAKLLFQSLGKKFGVVGDLVFEIRTGELIYLLLKQPTIHANQLEMEKTQEGDIMIPFSSVIASGDFVVVAEEDIV